MAGYLNQKQMKKMSTKRLLAYYRGLLKVHETPHYEKDPKNTQGTRQDPLWEQTREIAKLLLDQREHVEGHPRKMANPMKEPKPFCQCEHSYSSHCRGEICWKCECKKYETRQV
jgi:poly(3-hydroxybutyrate) depolymerase